MAPSIEQARIVGGTSAPPRRGSLLSPIIVGLLWRIAIIGVIRWDFAQGDSAPYIQLALNLLRRHVYALSNTSAPTVIRPPLLPMEIAGVFGLVGVHTWAIQALQVALSVAAGVILATAVGRFSPRVGYLCLWAFMLSPFDAVYSGAILTECLCTFLLIAALAAPILLRHAGFLVSGIALGALCLSRDVYLFLIPLLAAAAAIGLPERGFQLPRARVRQASLVLLGAALVIFPWTVRNRMAVHHWVAVSDGLKGENLWLGVIERWPAWQAADLLTAPVVYRNAAERQRATDLLRSRGEPGSDVGLMQLAIARWREAPLRTLETCLIRVPRLWIGTRFDLFVFRPRFLAYGSLPWKLLKAALLGLDFLVVVLAGYGLFLSRREAWVVWFAIPIVYTALIYFPFHTETRFTQPIFYLLLFFACLAVATTWNSRARSITNG